jgi:hypothetical protein
LASNRDVAVMRAWYEGYGLGRCNPPVAELDSARPPQVERHACGSPRQIRCFSQKMAPRKVSTGLDRWAGRGRDAKLVVSTLVVSTLWYLQPSNERRHPVRQNASFVTLLIKPVVRQLFSNYEASQRCQGRVSAAKAGVALPRQAMLSLFVARRPASSYGKTVPNRRRTALACRRTACPR